MDVLVKMVLDLIQMNVGFVMVTVLVKVMKVLLKLRIELLLATGID